MATTLPLRLTLALALTLTPLTATAQFRSGTASWIPVPTGEITFSDRADDELVTNQYFSSDGVTFTNVKVNSTSTLFSDAPYVWNNTGPGPWTPITIRWESAVFSIAWLGIANRGSARLEGFLSGTPVVQSDFEISLTPTWFGFESITLDEIRITAPTGTNGMIGLDNLQWFRQPPSSVPEPGALLLLGVGLVGIALRRRGLVT